jgi:hypothetical protein
VLGEGGGGNQGGGEYAIISQSDTATPLTVTGSVVHHADHGARQDGLVALWARRGGEAANRGGGTRCRQYCSLQGLKPWLLKTGSSLLQRHPCDRPDHCRLMVLLTREGRGG